MKNNKEDELKALYQKEMKWLSGPWVQHDGFLFRTPLSVSLPHF